jgi:hypothetical protein
MEKEKEDLIEICAKLFYHFVDILEAPKENPELSLIDFLEWLTRPETDFLANILNKSDLRFEDEHAEDVLFILWEKVAALTFGVGFAIGTLADKDLHPKYKEYVERIKTAMYEEMATHPISEARA